MDEILGDIIVEHGYSIARQDLERPWGGFIVLREEDAPSFITTYFPEEQHLIVENGIITPKFLLIEPGKRLSWQYHLRRSECWRVLHGRVGVMRSTTDEMPDEIVVHEKGDVIMIGQEERHRLVGLEEWAVVAEIWIHSDATLPSDEADIVRVQDDFQR